MKTFLYQDQLYIRCIPSKRLFNSTMVHEVVNRGDIFALRVSDQALTILPGTSQVTHTSHDLTISAPKAAAADKVTATSTNSKTKAATARARLKELADELRAGPKQLSIPGIL